MGNNNTSGSPPNGPNGSASINTSRNGTKIDEANEKYFGLENFGNTCYANSVLQALYFCKPFRNHILHYYKTLPQNSEPNLLISLADLFYQLNNQKKKTGYLGPKAFIQRLRMDNEMFKSLMQQDAQEFLNYILNHFVEILQHELKNQQELEKNEDEDLKKVKTFIHDIFEGTLINETRCIMCENVTSREESFLDLSVDVQQYSSITQCLKNFSGMQILKSNNKFYCDRCCSHQEAQTSMKIKRQPQVLAIQLKRFKYMNNNFKKLSYRVTFPFDFKLPNLSQDEKVKTYRLFAAVVHIGSGPNCGHYKCIVRSEERWFLFDDDKVSNVDEDYVKSTFGFPHDEAASFSGISETCYILFYSSFDEEM